ncbi:MAG: FtsW/RodA/SpoVE family cell cycle protein [Clostridia bacterium]|nr:FtsW/RodA/SpoVE family cell cycle protein [Clostridia bacterium]
MSSKRKRNNSANTLSVIFDDLRARISACDPILIVFALCMALYGLLVISSAVHASIPDGWRYLLIQSFAILLGLLTMFLVSFLDYEQVIRRLHVPLFLFTIFILVITLFIGSGEGSNKSWIRFTLLPIGVQPSEFAKIFFICTYAYHLSRVRSHLNKWKTLFGLCLHFGVVTGCVLLQGDLGSALVFVFIFFCMSFCSGLRLRYFLAASALVLGASPFLWEHLSYYQRQRILVGFSPEADPQGFGYQVLRAKQAIANGGFRGMGYLSGALSQSSNASALPKRHTDLIFSVMAEEFGFLGICIYLALYVLLILRLLHLSRTARGYMGSYICIGAAAVFIFQGLENMGMCMGVLPVIGLTLPFMSYGGSSVVSLFLLLGVAESVASHRVKYYIEREEEVL